MTAPTRCQHTYPDGTPCTLDARTHQAVPGLAAGHGYPAGPAPASDAPSPQQSQQQDHDVQGVPRAGALPSRLGGLLGGVLGGALDGEQVQVSEDRLHATQVRGAEDHDRPEREESFRGHNPSRPEQPLGQQTGPESAGPDARIRAKIQADALRAIADRWEADANTNPLTHTAGAYGRGYRSATRVAVAELRDQADQILATAGLPTRDDEEGQ